MFELCARICVGVSQSFTCVSWIVIAADLVDAVLAVDRVGRLERAGGERAGDA